MSEGCKCFPLLCALNLTPVRCNSLQEHSSEAVRRTECFGQSLQIFSNKKLKLKCANLNYKNPTRERADRETKQQQQQLLWSRIDAEEKAEHLHPEDGFNTTVSDVADRTLSVNPPALACLFVKHLNFQKGCLVQHSSHEPRRDSQQYLFRTPTWQTTFQKNPHSSFTFISLVSVKYSRSIQPSHFPYSSVIQALFQ